jgi:hypothetical protein
MDAEIDLIFVWLHMMLKTRVKRVDFYFSKGIYKAVIASGNS